MTHPGSFLRLVVALLATACLSTPALRAQSLTWTPTNGPYGGLYTDHIAVGRGGVIYAGSNQKIYVSTDHGTTWRKTTALPMRGFVIYGMAIDSTGALLVGGHGNDSGAVLVRSTDMGASWVDMKLPGSSGAAIAVASDGTIYAGGPTPNSVLKRTTDFGNTWDSVGVSTIIGGGIAALPDGTIISGGSNDQASGAFRSGTGSAPWSMGVGLGFTTIPIDFGVVRADTVYMIATGGSLGGELMQSTDGGRSWSIGTLLRGEWVKTNVAVDARGTVYVGTQNGGIHRSTDGGATWSQMNSGLINLSVGALEVTADGTIIAGTAVGIARWSMQDGVWRSANDGIMELPIDMLGITDAGTLYAANRVVGVFSSSDKGGSWQSIGPGATNASIGALAVTPFGDVVVGLSNGRVMRMTGPGSWTPSNSSLDSSITAMTVVTDDDNESESIYAGTAAGSVYRSTTSGSTWVRVNESQRGAFRSVVDLASTSDGTLYAATRQNIYRLLPTESTWTRVNVGEGTPVFTHVAANGSYVAVTMPQAGWVSTDAGTTWNRLPSVSNDNPYSLYYSIGITPRNNVLAGYGGYDVTAPAYHLGLRLPGWSQNTWADAETGLDPTAPVLSFAFARDRTIYAGALGVYTATEPAASVREPAAVAAADLVVEPMPASGDAVVRFSLSYAGRYRATLHDLNGRVIAVGFDGDLRAGVNALHLDLSDVTPGVYMVHVVGAETKRGLVVVR